MKVNNQYIFRFSYFIMFNSNNLETLRTKKATIKIKKKNNKKQTSIELQNQTNKN